MASVKIASLFIKTVSKPIANKLKQQAQEHESFRNLCISLAQGMHSAEVRLRTNVMGEKTPIRPLNDAKAITNGATALAEGFLFFVGVSLVVGEAWRSSRSASKRKDDVDDRIRNLEEGVEELRRGVIEAKGGEEEMIRRQEEKLERLESVLQQVISIGLRGGWLDLSTIPHHPSNSSPSSSTPNSTSKATRESQILPFIQLQAQSWSKPPLSATTGGGAPTPSQLEAGPGRRDEPPETDEGLRLA